ncbi:class I SAM-dependent methyltransferase [Nocardia sp. NPDC005366]|uniref:class I SAM-dependent methyltransferase n=1 Tax=Nocardia sp. NPDC005366 TaxID=3156878 RepID=UPI0033B45C64
MPLLRSQQSLTAYYTAALAIGDTTPENLQQAVTPEFMQLLATTSLTGSTRTALDIGYGAGAYAIALAQNGFEVQAVDRVAAELFTSRLPASDWAAHIRAVCSPIQHYPITEPVGVLVAKDVLHYLQRSDVYSVLDTAITVSVPGSCHYLQIFTDIDRTDPDGKPVGIEDELDSTTDQLITDLEQLYRGWSLHHTTTDHRESDRSTGRPYFHATKVTTIARRGNP